MPQDRIKTSFIPKASLAVEATSSVRNTTFGVVNVIASVVLIAAIIAAGGLFAFEKYVQASIQGKRTSLDRARAAFQPETIKELARLDTRLSVGAALLSSHTAPSALFTFIERETLASVRFSDFSYSEVGPGRTMLTMSGQARSFNAEALQSDAFGKSALFSEVIFSNLNIDTKGTVVFDFSAVVDTDELAYRGDFARRAPENSPASAETQGATPDEGATGETP